MSAHGEREGGGEEVEVDEAEAAEMLGRMDEGEIAAMLEGVDRKKVAQMLAAINGAEAAGMMEGMNQGEVMEMMEGMDQEKLAEMMGGADAAEVAEMMAEMRGWGEEQWAEMDAAMEEVLREEGLEEDEADGGDWAPGEGAGAEGWAEDEEEAEGGEDEEAQALNWLQAMMADVEARGSESWAPGADPERKDWASGGAAEAEEDGWDDEEDDEAEGGQEVLELEPSELAGNKDYYAFAGGDKPYADGPDEVDPEGRTLTLDEMLSMEHEPPGAAAAAAEAPGDLPEVRPSISSPEPLRSHTRGPHKP